MHLELWVNWQTAVRFVFLIHVDLFHFLQGTVVYLFIPTLLLDLPQDFAVIFAIVSSEPRRLNWLDVVLKHLSDRALLLLLEHIKEEHELVLPLLSNLNVIFVLLNLLSQLSIVSQFLDLASTIHLLLLFLVIPSINFILPDWCDFFKRCYWFI